MTDYTYRPYEDSDADRAIDLFSTCFQKTMHKADWHWRYQLCPHGQNNIVCEHGKDIVGFYGVVLRPLMIHNRETMAGHVLDVMTHPNYRGEGIFTNSAKVVFSVARKRGVSVLFGFPNRSAWPGHRKVNWRDFGRRMILMRPLAQIPDIGNNESDFAIGRPSWEEMRAYSNEIDSMFWLVSARHQLVADRRWEWLRWRYGQRPDFDYSALTCRSREDNSLRGLMIVTTRQFEGRKVGHIVDWLNMPGEDGAVRILESVALRHFVAQGCEYAQCLDNRDLEEAQPSDRAWRSEDGRELKFAMRSTDENGDNTPQTELSHCYLSLGDCDVF